MVHDPLLKGPDAAVPALQARGHSRTHMKMQLQPPCKALVYLIRRQLNLSSNVSLSTGMY